MDAALSAAYDAYVDARIDAKLATVLARLAVLEAVAVPPAPQSPGAKVLRLGQNLIAPTYYEAPRPFTDLVRTAQVNGAGQLDYSWFGTAGVQLDQDGWPLGIIQGQSVETAMARVKAHYPGGEYRLSWEGTGVIALQGDATGIFTTSPATIHVTPTDAGITLKITRSTQGDAVRRVRLVPAAHADEVFDPVFLDGLRPYSALRFMDWGRTNRSPVVEPTDRVRPDHRSWVKGVPWETQLALCNALGADAWVCLPHQASQAYVEAAAAAWRGLRPGLRLYLEYTNEHWNGAFSQSAWLEGLSGTENRSQTYARLATTHFATWERVWGGRDRLVRVLAGQAANADVVRQVLVAAGPDGCDAIAMAPYFGGSLGGNEAVATWSVDQVLAACRAELPTIRTRIDAHRALADQYGVALVAYEGGQHLAAVGASAQANAALVAKLTEVNRAAGMEQLYLDYLDQWRQAGGGLFCHYADCYLPKDTGNWGALEWQDQPATPKSRALVATAAAWAR